MSNVINMHDIQQECIKRFPIGCSFINTDGGEFVLKADKSTYNIVKNQIYAHSCCGLLYDNGVFATNVSNSEICETCNGEGTVMTAKLYPSGHTEVTETCPDCNGAGDIEVKDSKTLLLEEARKRYPVGTHFYPAHVRIDKDFCIVTNTKFKWEDDSLFILTDDSKIWDGSSDSKYGNTDYNRIIYHNAKWATIKENEPIVKSDEKLIEEAKKRYPVGTHFYPAHMVGSRYCITTNTNFKEENGNVYAMTDENQYFNSDEKYGNTSYDRVVYYSESGEWAQIKTTSDEDWILEAKKRYPVGTKFVPAHIKTQDNPTEFCIVTNDNFERSKHGHIYALTNGGSCFTDEVSHGNTQSNRIIYDSDKKKWAQIYQPHEKDILEVCRAKYKKGMKVQCKSFDPFVITVDPEEFRFDGRESVDYEGSPCFLCLHGEYAVILDDTDVVSGKTLNLYIPVDTYWVNTLPKISIKKPKNKISTHIDDVKTVNINLVKKSKKLIFNI